MSITFGEILFLPPSKIMRQVFDQTHCRLLVSLQFRQQEACRRIRQLYYNHQRPASLNLAGRFYVCTAGAFLRCFFCLSVLCHSHSCGARVSVGVRHFDAWLPPPYPEASYGYSLFQVVPAGAAALRGLAAPIRPDRGCTAPQGSWRRHTAV